MQLILSEMGVKQLTRHTVCHIVKYELREPLAENNIKYTVYNIQLIRLLYYLRSTMYKVMEQFEDTEISASKCDGIIQGND